MLAAERRNHILQDILDRQIEAVGELSRRYKVSEMTIRRDLELLEKQGHVERTHGGAIGRTTTNGEPRFVAKQELHTAQKHAIAQYAAEMLVVDGDIIMLEGGTTVTMMVPYLKNKQHVTVVTNGLYTLNELARTLPHTSVIATGGIMRDVSLTFVGPVVEDFFRSFHANKLFLSATGLTVETGLTDPNMLEAQAKRAMIAATKEIIVLLDSSKIGVRSLTTVLPTERISVLVTDTSAPAATVEALQGLGVCVICLAPLEK